MGAVLPSHGIVTSPPKMLQRECEAIGRYMFSSLHGSKTSPGQPWATGSWGEEAKFLPIELL